MKITYDKIANAVYMTLRKGRVAKTVEMSDNVIIDLDKSGHLLGIEMLNASSQLSKTSIKNGVSMDIPVEIISGIPVVA